MDTNKLVGKILVTARHIPSGEFVKTTIDFEDRVDSVYYCWTFNDSMGKSIAGKCVPISNKVIDTDRLDFAINHAKDGIDHYKADRQKLFEVIEIKKL